MVSYLLKFPPHLCTVQTMRTCNSFHSNQGNSKWQHWLVSKCSQNRLMIWIFMGKSSRIQVSQSCKIILSVKTAIYYYLCYWFTWGMVVWYRLGLPSFRHACKRVHCHLHRRRSRHHSEGVRGQLRSVCDNADAQSFRFRAQLVARCQSELE